MEKRDLSKMLEAEIQRRFIAEATTKKGVFCRKIVSVGRRGMPDIIYIYDEQVTFIEMKRSNGTLTTAQELCHGHLRAAGARVVTLYGWAQAQRWLS